MGEFPVIWHENRECATRQVGKNNRRPTIMKKTRFRDRRESGKLIEGGLFEGRGGFLAASNQSIDADSERYSSLG